MTTLRQPCMDPFRGPLPPLPMPGRRRRLPVLWVEIDGRDSFPLPITLPAPPRAAAGASPTFHQPAAR